MRWDLGLPSCAKKINKLCDTFKRPPTFFGKPLSNLAEEQFSLHQERDKETLSLKLLQNDKGPNIGQKKVVHYILGT